MFEVKRRRNETIEKLIRRFKRATEDSGVIQELRARSFFVKPSAKRKLKSLRAQARRRKEERLAAKKEREALAREMNGESKGLN